jgi:very-short-patch-repair endonuclease
MQGSIRARQLRRNLTDAERRLWYRVRGRRFFRYKIRRQVAMGPYVADFVCMDARLIIEIDGGQHAERSLTDERRDRLLRELEFVTLRFWNNEVLGNFDGVLCKLKEVLDARVAWSGWETLALALSVERGTAKRMKKKSRSHRGTHVYVIGLSTSTRAFIASLLP